MKTARLACSLFAWAAWAALGPAVARAVTPTECELGEAARFKLRGLDPAARYTITNLDSGQSEPLAGSEMLEKGLAVAIPEQPGSAVITYRKK